MENHIKILKNVILYKGEFYNETSLEVSLHNRIDSINYTIKNIDILPKEEINDLIEFDKPILFLGGFEWNMGHLLWDAMYPSWYGLFFYNEQYWDKNFQWITLNNMYEKFKHDWHQDILEKFSGNSISTPEKLSNRFGKPLKIKLLITGIKNLGIGCVDKNICVNKSFKTHVMDPVESFVNRFYVRYKIDRNNYNKGDEIKDIIYILNKRPYNGIEELFKKLNTKYKNVYNFKIINLSNNLRGGRYCSNSMFENQLKILNTTRIIICGVGTARTSSPFIPNGSIEIQTNLHDSSKAHDYISFFDTHIGTISNYLKVINIDKYDENESNHNLVSKEMEQIIENTLNQIPYKHKINVEENLPILINKVKYKITDDRYNKWRNSLSNNIDYIIFDYL